MQNTIGRMDTYGSATEWLTSDEAALYLKIERRTLLQWLRQGKVRAYILSGVQRHLDRASDRSSAKLFKTWRREWDSISAT